MNEPRIVTDVPTLPARDNEGHKGTYGRVLIVAGSRGMTGAAILSGSAALRGGAGLVFVATPDDALPLVALGNPCYLTVAIPENASQPIAGVDEADVVAVGPGMGKGRPQAERVASLLKSVAVPLVIDADGLNNLAVLDDALTARSAKGRATVLTPHPGEFARLIHVGNEEVIRRREELALQFAKREGVVLVLKGHQTLVTDGERLYRNTTGNPGMGTGGTGDVLTGLLTALIGQKLDPFDAAQLGVYLHGLAGDLARDAVGEVSLIASDLLEYLPAAFRRHQGR